MRKRIYAVIAGFIILAGLFILWVGILSYAVITVALGTLLLVIGTWQLLSGIRRT